jgi:hypothetical protein
MPSEGHRYMTGLTGKWRGGCTDRQTKYTTFHVPTELKMKYEVEA